MMKVHIKEKFNTSMGTIINVDSNEEYRVGTTIMVDDGKEYKIIAIMPPTRPIKEDIVSLVVS